MTVEAINYAIDQEDRLIRADEGFYRFAAENGWNGAGNVLGRSLWDFIAGQDVRGVKRLLLQRVRNGVCGVELPLRCDSPRLAREMDVRIEAGDSGRVVLFSARLRSEIERSEPQPLLDPGAPRDEGDFLSMCAWCNRFLVAGKWVEVEEAARSLGLLRRPRMPTLDHGICPNCSGRLVAA